MSTSNQFIVTQLLDRFYEALKVLSSEQLTSCVTEDFMLDWKGSDSIPWAGRWHGVNGLISFVKVLNEKLQILEVQRLKQFSDQDTTVVLLRGHWKAKESGNEVRAMACNVFTFENQKIKSYTVLNNTVAFSETLSGRTAQSAV